MLGNELMEELINIDTELDSSFMLLLIAKRLFNV